MSFTADATNAQIDSSMGAVVMLNSSCQGVVEAEIQQVSSPWYQTLDQELGQAEELVLRWRRSGILYFEQNVLASISAAGNGFVSGQSRIDGLFTALETQWSPDVAAELLAALEALQAPVDAIDAQIADYLARLKAFEADMETPHQAMLETIGEVQAQEAQIQSQITALNGQIASLNQQLQADREAISKARASRTRGIVETIFGALLAPVTGGISLVLLGVGVATIAEAEEEVNQLQSSIATAQQTIAADASSLTQDQAMVATLNALTVSTGLVLSDMELIEQQLDALRTGWTTLAGELGNIVADVRTATSSQDIVGQVWFDAACTEFQLILDHVADLSGRPLSTRTVTIG